MKLFHLSDLHIGKQLHGFSLIEDQTYILGRILKEAEQRKPDVIVIAGDVDDKSVPSAEAVEVFDGFLTSLAAMEQGLEVFIVSGNHDSQERLAFGSRLFEKNRIFIAGMAPGKENPRVQKLVRKDKEGEVNFYLLPFLRPSFIREIEGMEQVKTYDEAVRAVIAQMEPDFSARNVLVCHQFFTWNGKSPERSDSETVSVGGQDNVEVSAVETFDYVAAGHIHRPQSVGGDHVRYCGSPLKYSVSEAGQEKGILEVTLGKKGDVTVEKIPLVPLRDVRKIRGKLSELISEETLSAADPKDFVSAVLTDEEELYEPGRVLSRHYPNLLEWTVENSRTRREFSEEELPAEKKSLPELFEEFYIQMQGAEMKENQRKAMEEIFLRLEAGGEEEA